MIKYVIITCTLVYRVFPCFNSEKMVKIGVRLQKFSQIKMGISHFFGTLCILNYRRYDATVVVTHYHEQISYVYSPPPMYTKGTFWQLCALVRT